MLSGAAVWGRMSHRIERSNLVAPRKFPLAGQDYVHRAAVVDSEDFLALRVLLAVLAWWQYAKVTTPNRRTSEIGIFRPNLQRSPYYMATPPIKIFVQSC